MNEAVKYPQHAHRKDMTFRQAEGIDPLPKMLAHGELAQSLRLEIWDVLYSFFHTLIYYPSAGYTRSTFKGDALGPAIWYCREFLCIPIDEAKAQCEKPREFIARLKQVILNGSYFDCLGSVEFFIRFPNFRLNVKKQLVDALNKPTSPYMAVDMDPWTIIPCGDENERASFERDWPAIASSPFDGSKAHLRLAAEELNKGSYPAAMREAIHAVESAAKIITGQPSADLAAALKILGKDRGLHSALKDGFIKLYGYASDEKGVRHALIDATNSNVGKEDALFFFSACTAFVAYLARKFAETS